MDKYKVISFIGEGSFGRVFKVVNKETNSTFALKVIRKIGRSSRDLKNLRQECDIQQYLRHPNIIQMIESFDTDSELVVVTEFAEKELHGVLGREGCLPEAKAQVLTWDLVSALYYLHSHRVLHRDLKPQNVLIDSHGRAKLCDFGLARNMTSGTHVLTSIKGTPLYMAPELIDEKPYDHQADLWSLGCIVYEMMAGQPPFFTTSIVQLVRLIRHRPILWPSYISQLAIQFLQGLLHKDPTLRLSWPEILAQPFVAGHVSILQEKSPTDSPFTLPLSKSQMAAKQLQKDRLNSIQKFMPQAVKILAQRERMRSGKNPISIHNNAPASDDDSTKMFSAASIRDSIRTDDEIEGTPEVQSYDKYIEDSRIKDISKNKPSVKSQSITKENKESKTRMTSGDTCVENKKAIINTSKSDMNIRKLSQDIENFSIHSKENSQEPEKEIEEKLAIADLLPKDALLSKSVPPTFKQKLLQFSRDKFGSVNGNKLTRSLKKSFHLSKEKNKPNKERRMSEPVPLTTSSISASITMESYEEKEEECKSMEEIFNEELKEVDDGKLDDTVSCDGQTFFDDDCNPIEKDEWLAFMRSNMNEIMEGDVESLMQQNIVSMIVSVARHKKAGAEVYGTLAALFSLPIVAPLIDRDSIDKILKVYQEVKLVPNLVYAARLLVKQSASESENKCSHTVAALNNEEIVALGRLVELISHLCLRDVTFVQQLCDAVAILNTASLLAQFLSIGDKSQRIVMNTITMLIIILHDLPENAELVESILFEGATTVDICRLLEQPNETLKVRACVLIDLLSRHCCAALSKYLNAVWGNKQRETLETLQTHPCEKLSRAAKCAVGTLNKLSFYKQSNPR